MPELCYTPMGGTGATYQKQPLENHGNGNYIHLADRLDNIIRIINIITRKGAKEQGLKRYFTGKPCRNGHVSERRVSNGKCLGCLEANKEKATAYQKAYREANPEKIAARRKVWYEANSEKVNANVKAYREANPEKIAAYQKAHYEANPEKYSGYHKAYRDANPEKRAAINAKRRASKIQRTPSWYNHNTSIVSIYQHSKVMEEQTGIGHDVDHEIPLQGELVSGLHVSDNLKVIEASANRSKHNAWNPMTEIIMHKNDDGTYTQEVTYLC